MKMTKQQAVQVFKSEILPSIPKHDIPMQTEAWSNYTDMLCKDGKITLKQYETWQSPVKDKR